MVKPGRSEEADLDAEEQARFTEAVRQKFAEQAPARRSKPSRSEDAPPDSPPPAPSEGPIAEHLRLRKLLETSAGGFTSEFGGDVPQEYVETDYYKGFNDADQTLHHTTGSGFIQVQTNRVVDLASLPDTPILVRSEVTEVNYETPEEFTETEYYNDLNAVHDKALHHTTGTGFIKVEKNGAFALNVASSLVRTNSGCNPATNDWIPIESTTTVVRASKKPEQSES